MCPPIHLENHLVKDDFLLERAHVGVENERAGLEPALHSSITDDDTFIGKWLFYATNYRFQVKRQQSGLELD